jgi:ribose-phosphate pyrophosphokinase
MPVLLDYIRGESGGDVVVVAPDAGRVKVAERYSQALQADLAFVHKRHVKGVANSVEARGVIGDVNGRRCVVIDDMIDTAGTIVAAADILLDNGATEVWAMATHGLLSGPAIDRLSSSKIARTVITNTLPLPPEKQLPNLEVLSVAQIIADAIDAVFEDTSVSEIFGGENLT